MKKLPIEEYNNLLLRSTGRGSHFFKAIIGLMPGEALFISKEEYTLSYGPGRICRRIMKRFPKTKFISNRIADGSGWAVKRVK